MSNQYQTLITILDRLCSEAPSNYKRYHVLLNNTEKMNQARSRALIHLYLKVNFGILDFKNREDLITDDPHDGGVDAYFIDKERKKIYLIQSKFRTNSKNYEEKEISLDEILQMEVDRITEGKTNGEDGYEYNQKIKKLQCCIAEMDDVGRYTYEIVILANLKDTTPNKLRKLTGGFNASVLDFKKVYSELLFPVVTGTFYDQSELSISLNLSNKSASSARINYSVDTEYEGCDITVVFVPTEEIGKILYKYKNSILKYNPRCYLELRTNSVNAEIYGTIVNKQTNEFALFNNGITMLSDQTSFNEKVGQVDR